MCLEATEGSRDSSVTFKLSPAEIGVLLYEVVIFWVHDLAGELSNQRSKKLSNTLIQDIWNKILQQIWIFS